MKKLRTIFAILVALSLIVVGCSSKSAKNDTKSDGKNAYKIGVVTGEGGAKDKSFNQANVEAIQAWAKANGAKDPVVIETKNQADLAANLQNAAKVSDIVSLAGYEFEKEITKTAEQYKDKKFMYVDSFVDAPNIASLIFKEQEAGYLAGYAAALQSKTGKVGFIGGTKIPPVERFGIGFVQGAKDGKEYQKSAILTSAVKNIEVAVTKILNEIKEGKFTKGEHIFGIKENGVGIPKENPNLSEEAKTKISKAVEELKSGKAEVVATGDELKAKGAATNIEGEL